MKIKKITRRSLKPNEMSALTSVGTGFLQGDSGSLPDVDNDFQSDKRQDVKAYLEKRYNINGLNRVFSAGTVGALKIKRAIKDVGKLYGVPDKVCNIVSKAIKNDNGSWSDLMIEAFNEKATKGAKKNIYNFIKNYPNIINDIRYIMGAPRDYSIHASAIIITPTSKVDVDGTVRENVECYDFLPLKKVAGGILTSDFDGYSIDDIGLLKNDVLSTIELTKVKGFFDLIKENYGLDLNVEYFAESDMNHPDAFRVIANGHTQGVFQFSGEGMTKFMVDMEPTRFEDLIAGTSLFRPASLQSGSATRYNDCKKEIIEPTYLWGTYDILKETYGVLAYQEQLAQMAREVGGFSIAEGVRLVKLISKKKTDKIHEMKGKFLDGAKQRGCPDEDAKQIWAMIESGGSYLFNKCISGKEAIVLSDNSSLNVKGLYDLYMTPNVDKLSALSIDTNTLDVHHNIVKDVRYMGERELYRITLATGSHFDATDNHKHPTQRGEVQTKHLTLGDSLFIYSNGEVTPSEVKSVEFVGYDEVYDIEMEAPYHNFIVDSREGGIVTCNSHATAYSVISYIGAYVKALYPVIFYTVTLEHAGKDDVPEILKEVPRHCDVKVVKPDINTSSANFCANVKENSIYWSLNKIFGCGGKAVSTIVKNREVFGSFKSLEDFMQRVRVKAFIQESLRTLSKSKEPITLNGKEFSNGRDAKKYASLLSLPDQWELFRNEELTPAQRDYMDQVDTDGGFTVGGNVILSLILAGCFDDLEGCKATTDRWGLIQIATKILKTPKKDLDEMYPVDMRDKHFFWSSKQIEVSGLGFVDYKRIYDSHPEKAFLKRKGVYMDFSEIEQPDSDGKRISFCATISAVYANTYVDKKTGETKNYCKVILSQNKESTEITFWNEMYEKNTDILSMENVGRIVVGNCNVRYSNWHKKNALNANYNTNFYLI